MSHSVDVMDTSVDLTVAFIVKYLIESLNFVDIWLYQFMLTFSCNNNNVVYLF